MDLYDDVGVEAGTMGSIIAMAYEAYERGLLTKADTDGLELSPKPSSDTRASCPVSWIPRRRR